MSAHQTFIRLTRNFSEIFPAGADLTFTDAEAVIRECEHCWRHHGHCENPYPSKDPRFAVWAEHTLRIWERLKILATPIDGEFEVVADNDPIPFPIPPAPVPEEEQPDEPEDLPAAALFHELNKQGAH